MNPNGLTSHQTQTNPTCMMTLEKRKPVRIQLGMVLRLDAAAFSFTCACGEDRLGESSKQATTFTLHSSCSRRYTLLYDHADETTPTRNYLIQTDVPHEMYVKP